jgi:integral membrane protein
MQDQWITKYFLQIGKLEGYSYLFLLLVAMPLKYIFKQPQFVLYTGYIHGVLFISFIVFLALVFFRGKLNFKNSAFALLLSLIPFGTFYLKNLFKDKN